MYRLSHVREMISRQSRVSEIFRRLSSSLLLIFGQSKQGKVNRLRRKLKFVHNFDYSIINMRFLFPIVNLKVVIDS